MPSQEPPLDEKSEEVDLPPEEDTVDGDGSTIIQIPWSFEKEKKTYTCI